MRWIRRIFEGLAIPAAVLVVAGLVWTDARIEELIRDPAKFLDGYQRMRYPPITDPDERREIVQALKEATR